MVIYKFAISKPMNEHREYRNNFAGQGHGALPCCLAYSDSHVRLVWSLGIVFADLEEPFGGVAMIKDTRNVFPVGSNNPAVIVVGGHPSLSF